MNHRDLKELLNKIDRGSMCRDEIFYDEEYGYEIRRVEFFKNIRELQEYFEYYLLEKENLMKGIEFDNHGFPICKEPTEKKEGEEHLWGIMKGVNSYSQRNKNELETIKE